MKKRPRTTRVLPNSSHLKIASTNPRLGGLLNQLYNPKLNKLCIQ